tara:strand:- start:59 stop:571 length:513 start_codon:yes stop_codon:yes gene_type:complete
MEFIHSLTMREEWIFAHLYGLYNIGVCTINFALKHAADWEGVHFLPKAVGIALENGKDVTVSGKHIKSLLSVSEYTLASDGCDVSELDTVSISCTTLKNQKRFVSYIASIGVYKTFTADSSFTVPVYTSPRPTCASDREVLRDVVGGRLVTSMTPLIMCSAQISKETYGA